MHGISSAPLYRKRAAPSYLIGWRSQLFLRNALRFTPEVSEALIRGMGCAFLRFLYKGAELIPCKGATPPMAGR